LESDDDIRYPRYGQYGDPKRAEANVCRWCGKNEVKRILGGLACSHRCYGAIFIDSYKKFKILGAFLPVIFLGLLLFIDDLLVLILDSAVVLLMMGWWVYSIWMVHTGQLMIAKSFVSDTENSPNSY
jgi:hypothetical protein